MNQNRRWLKGYAYNVARVLETIADMVVARGGEVRFKNDGMEIATRGYVPFILDKEEEIRRISEAISKAEKEDELQLRLDHLQKKKEELEELKRKEQEAPIIRSRLMSKYVPEAGTIDFSLDGINYYLSMDENPLFPDYYYKVPDGETGHGEQLVPEDDPKPWQCNALLEPCAEAKIIRWSAEKLLELLFSKPFTSTTRR